MVSRFPHDFDGAGVVALSCCLDGWCRPGNRVRGGAGAALDRLSAAMGPVRIRLRSWKRAPADGCCLWGRKAASALICAESVAYAIERWERLGAPGAQAGV